MKNSENNFFRDRGLKITEKIVPLQFDYSNLLSLSAHTHISLLLSERRFERRIARQNRMPYIQFVESAGGDLRGDDDPERQMREQSDHFGESGRLFYDVTELSKLGIPSISVVFGSSTAGGAYQPGMSDYNIFVRNQSKVFLGGPPLVKMATGEDSDDGSQGGDRLRDALT